MGLSGTALSWFESYVTGRSQSVIVNCLQSSIFDVQFGVPQGSVLGPVLYTLYTTPLGKIIKEHNINYHMYADDTQLYKSVPFSDLQLLVQSIETCSGNVNKWMTDNKLKMNNEKTEILLCGPKKYVESSDCDHICIEGENILFSDNARNLGVYFDCTFSMEHHVKQLCKSLFFELRKISHMRAFLNEASLQKLVTSFVLTKILTQLSKFTSLKNHPMHSKVEKKHPKRLKRSNFLETARTLQKDLEIPPFDQDGDLPTYQQFPLWNAKAPVVVKDSIPGIARKDSMSLQDLETKTSDFINTNYPSELWIRVYTDGSAEEAVRNGGGGVLIEWLDGTKIENSIPTGRHSTNYKAEAAAIEEAVALLHVPKSYNKNIVLLSDAKSVLQALHNPRNREHSNLKASLLQLGLTAQQIVLQWLPGHCNIWGNTRADQLAKEGSQLEQLDGGSSYAESKTLVKAAMARKWKSDHPDSDPSDPIHGMTRSQQTTIFRLRTGHNRLRQHMYKRFKVGDSEICPCGQAPQNTEHVLQTCSSHKQLRARTWPNHTPLEKKLYGTTEELALTVDYIVASGLTV